VSFDIPSDTPLGLIRRAPENFVSRSDIAFINRASDTDRRGFLKSICCRCGYQRSKRCGEHAPLGPCRAGRPCDSEFA